MHYGTLPDNHVTSPNLVFLVDRQLLLVLYSTLQRSVSDITARIFAGTISVSSSTNDTCGESQD